MAEKKRRAMRFRIMWGITKFKFKIKRNITRLYADRDIEERNRERLRKGIVWYGFMISEKSSIEDNSYKIFADFCYEIRWRTEFKEKIIGLLESILVV